MCQGSRAERVAEVSGVCTHDTHKPQLRTGERSNTNCLSFEQRIGMVPCAQLWLETFFLFLERQPKMYTGISLDQHHLADHMDMSIDADELTEAVAIPIAFHRLPVAAYTGAATITPCSTG